MPDAPTLDFVTYDSYTARVRMPCCPAYTEPYCGGGRPVYVETPEGEQQQLKYRRGEMVTIIATHSAGGYLSALVRTQGNDAGHWINIWSAFNREHIIRRHGVFFCDFWPNSQVGQKGGKGLRMR